MEENEPKKKQPLILDFDKLINDEPTADVLRKRSPEAPVETVVETRDFSGYNDTWIEENIQRDKRLLKLPLRDNGVTVRARLKLLEAEKERRKLLPVVRSLEAQGVPPKQVKAITAAKTEVLNDSLENVAHSFVSKEEMQKSAMAQEAKLSKFKSEVKSSQDHHFSSLHRETEKLRNDIDKMRNELRYEIDKVTAGQRLDLNLERGRIRDELANQNTETTNLTNKLDREIHTLRAELEAAKYDVIKYCIGTLISISAVGIAVLRIMSQR